MSRARVRLAGVGFGVGVAVFSTVCAAAEPAVPGATDAWWSRVREELARAEYEIRPGADGGIAACWQASNRAAGIRAYFRPGAVVIVPRAVDAEQFEWRLRLAEFGRRGAMRPAAEAMPVSCGSQVEYERDGLDEWYVNSPRGLEQGFTLLNAPEGAGAVRLEFETGGDLAPTLRAAEGILDLSRGGGGRVVSVGGLHAFDARGRRIDAKFELEGGRLAIVVEDAGATYPITIDPTIALADWTYSDGQENSGMGRAVASAGDVNGDGYSDVILGASYYDGSFTDQGRVYIFLGSSSGLRTTPAWVVDGPASTQSFGMTVGPAGDVNGDGFGDVFVCDPYFSDSVTPYRGRLNVYYGRPGGPNVNPDWSIKGSIAGGFFGYSAATAGDLNGDGYSDMIVGVPGYQSGGAAFVYYGSQNGLQYTPGWKGVGDISGVRIGYSVSPGGDVNGDGFPDVVVGADSYFANDPSGRVYGWYGSRDGLGPDSTTSRANWIPTESLGEPYLFMQVATAGDVDHDGFSDVLVINSYNLRTDGSLDGKVFLFRGSPTGLSAMADWYFPDQISAGLSAGAAGDVNGDAYDDVIIGSYNNYPMGAAIYLGLATGIRPTPDVVLNGGGNGYSFGTAVACAGDVNGDGLSDVIVGDDFVLVDELFLGRASVFYGKGSVLGLSSGWTQQGNQADGRFGYSVASAGDVNGDGFADVIAGSPMYDGTQPNSGKASVFLGSANGLATDPAWTFVGDLGGGQFGYSVASAGDVNGDNYDDIIVGAPFYNGVGRAYLFLGSPVGPAVTPSWQYAGLAASGQLGWCVASGGDVNGDGLADVLVSSNLYSNGEVTEGLVLEFNGSYDGLADSPSWLREGNQTFARYGESVASAGDVNGDGYSDVIVGAFNWSGRGRAFVYYGGAGGLSLLPFWQGDPGIAAARYGVSVGCAGDVNGDGYSDIIVGSTRYSNGQTNEGRAYVYHGSRLGLSTTPSWTSESNQANSEYGNSVAFAGDVNGDGFADVVVGAPLYDNGQTDEGRGYLYAGSASGLGQQAASIAESDRAAARFGWAVGTAGDVNGDGVAEVLVGSERLTGTQANQGQVNCYFGAGGTAGAICARQRRVGDDGPIARHGVSDRADGFRVDLIGRTPTGTGAVKAEIEVKRYDVQFDGTAAWISPDWKEVLPGGVPISAVIGGLDADTMYHWRMRLRYRPAGVSYPHSTNSRWIYGPAGTTGEADLHTLAPVVINAQPQGSAVCSGVEATLHVGAGGSGPLQYQWRKGGVVLSDGGNVSGSRSATLNLLPVVAGDAGAYDCVVSNGGSSESTETAELSVLAAPEIVLGPRSTWAAVGQRAEFTVVAGNPGGVSYQWRHGGAPLADGGAIHGATSAHLVIEPASATDAGTYDVVIGDGTCSSTSAVASLTLVRPSDGGVGQTGPAGDSEKR